MPQYDGPQLRPLPADELEALLQQRSEQQARPRQRPREVVAKWLDNLGVGIGAGLVVAPALWLIGVPTDVLLMGSGAVGLLAFGGMMVWRGATDEVEKTLSNRNVRRAVAHIRSQADAEVARMRVQLNAAYDVIEELERTRDQLAHERDLAQAEVGHLKRQAAERPSGQPRFVAPESLDTQDIADAKEMLRHYYDTGQHLSRRKAQETKRWTAERHDDAKSLLERAGCIRINATQAAYVEDSLPAALSKLSGYLTLASSRQTPPPVMHRHAYVETEEDDSTT